jgi:AraC-like DNA-binding protein
MMVRPLIPLSLRKLLRRLAEEGTTFTKVVDEVKCNAALSRLREDELPLEALDRHLGYSEHAAFTCALS